MNFGRLGKRLFAPLLLVGIIFIFSCEIGLGAAVDVSVPTSGISYPPQNAVIRDSFIAAGECNDDQVVVSVKVYLIDTENNITYGPYEANLDETKTSWAITLNTKDISKASNAFNSYKQWELPDGNYVINAVAYDSSNKSSAVATSPISIDNTAPVLIVSKPLAKGLSVEPTVYGSIVKLTGDIAEDHETSKLTISFREFDNSTGDFIAGSTVDTIEITDSAELNAMSSSNPLIIAKNSALNANQYANYQRLYDIANNTDDRFYYCGFLVEDNAKLYTNPGDSGSGTGNQTECYYVLGDDFKDNLAVNYSLTAQRLKEIFKGQSQDYNSTQIEGIASVLTSSANYASSTSITKEASSKFSLNPNNNPTWSLEECGIESETTADNIHSYAAGSSLILTLTAGRDASFPDPRTVKINLYDWTDGKEDTDPTHVVINNYYEAASFENNLSAQDFADGTLPSGGPFLCKHLLGPGGELGESWDESADDSVKTYTFTLDTEHNGLIANHIYQLVVTGTDRNDTDLLPADNKHYLFKLSTSNSIPRVTISSVTCGEKTGSDDTVFGTAVNGADGVVVSGNVIVDGVSLKSVANGGIKIQNLTVTDVATSTPVTGDRFNWKVINQDGEEITDLQHDPVETNKYLFNIKITGKSVANSSALSFVQADESKYYYTVTVRAEDKNNLSGEKNIKFYVDNKKPDVSVSLVTPTVSETTGTGASAVTTEYVNGNITVSGIASDSGNTGSGLQSINWYVKNTSDVTVKQGSITPPSESWSFPIETNGSEFTDGETYKVVIEATDIVGNKNETNATLTAGGANPAVKEIRINQETDKPSISVSNADASVTSADNAALGTTKNKFGSINNNTIYGLAKDDDGIGSVIVKWENAADSTKHGEKTLTVTGNPKEYNIEYRLAKSDTETLPQGKYKITIEVKDMYALSESTRQTSKDSVSTFFYVVVDDGAPTFGDLTVVHSDSTAAKTYPVNSYYPGSSSESTKTLTITGTVSDGSGIKSNSDNGITNAHLVKSGSDFVPPTESAATPESSSFVKTPETQNISKTITDIINLPSTSGTYKVKYTATDVYDQSNYKEFEYKVDANKPVITQVVVDGNEINKESSAESLPETSVAEDAPIGYIKKNNVNISATVADTHSGIDKVYYSLDNGTSWNVMTQSASINSNWSANVTFGDGDIKTLTIKAEDKTANIRTTLINVKVDKKAPTLDIFGYKLKDASTDEETSLLTPNGTAYVNNKDLVIFGNYSDNDYTDVTENGSGIKEPEFELETTNSTSPTAITPSENKYYNVPLTNENIEAVTDDANAATYRISTPLTAATAKTVKSFVQVISHDDFASGDLYVKGEDIAGNKIAGERKKIMTLDYDTTNPSVSGVSVSNSKSYKDSNTKYYINNKANDALSSFTVKGTSTDNSSVDRTVVKISQGPDASTSANVFTAETLAASWTLSASDFGTDFATSFANWDKNGNPASADAKVNIRVYDKAGNHYDYPEISLIFDTAGPEVLTGGTGGSDPADTSNPRKENSYKLRDNDVWKYEGIRIGTQQNPVTGVIGGAYSESSYGRESSVQIRMTFVNERGNENSGIKSIEYKMLPVAQVTSLTTIPSTGLLEGNPPANATYKTGSFDITDGTYTHYGETAEINCHIGTATISGFESTVDGIPNLVFVRATDKCGNTGSWFVLKIQVDDKDPEITPAADTPISLLTNGSSSMQTLSGTVTEKGAGLKALRVKINGTVVMDPTSSSSVDSYTASGYDPATVRNQTDVSFTNQYGTLTYTGYRDIPTESSPITSTSTKCSFADGASYASWTLTLTPQNGNWFSGISGVSFPAVTVEAEDWAEASGVGRTYPLTITSLDIDPDKPTTSIVEPDNSSALNGKQRLRGSVSEDHTPRFVEMLYYTVPANAVNTNPPASKEDWTLLKKITTDTGTNTGTIIYNAAPNNIYSFTQQIDFNAEQYLAAGTATGTVHVLLYAEDEAGNSNVDPAHVDADQNDNTKAYKTFTIDKNSDRPVVTVTNATLLAGGNSISTSNPLLLQTSTLNLKISDDDGIKTDASGNPCVEYRIVKEGQTATESGLYGWNQVQMTSSGASINFVDEEGNPSDGVHTVEFRVIDSENTTFESKALDNNGDPDTLHRIKLTDLSNNLYDSDPVIYVNIDTQPPELEIVGVEKLDAADASFDDEALTTEYSGDSMILGGPAARFLRVRVRAKDVGVGVRSVKVTAKFNNTAVTPITSSNSTTGSTWTAAADSENSNTDVYCNLVIPCTISNNSGNIVEADNATYVITVEAEDKTGQAGYGRKATESVTFNADTKKPVINVTAPSSEKNLSGSVTVEADVTENTQLYYSISPMVNSPDSTVAQWTFQRKIGTSDEFSSPENLPTADKSGAAITVASPLATVCAYRPVGNEEEFKSGFYMWLDGNTDESGVTIHGDTLNEWIKKIGISTEHDLSTAVNSFNDIVKLYFHVKAIDKAGNENENHYPLMLDPQGSRPVVNIGYPGNDKDGSTPERTLTLGGSPSIIGTATGVNNVDFVWMQIDTNADGDWDETDFNTLNTQLKEGERVYTLGNMISKATVTSLPDGAEVSQYAVKVPLSGISWSQKINICGELEPPESSSESTQNVTLWIYATDSQGYISSREIRRLIIDRDSPVIDQNLRLVQWASGKNGSNGFNVDSNGNITLVSGAVTAERSYTEGENIKGKWFLLGKVTDESGIQAIDFTVNNGSTVHAVTSTQDSYTGSGTHAGTYIRKFETSKTAADGTTVTVNNYIFCLPIGSETENAVGEYTIDFHAEEKEDTNPKPADATFKVTYDNKAPVVTEKLTGMAADAGTVAKPVIIENSNGVYTIKGQATEAEPGETGVDRIAFYFTRNIAGQTPSQATKIINPMRKVKTTANAIDYSGKTAENGLYEDGLYWESVTVNSVNLHSITVASVPSFVHIGGLAKVNGVLYRIEDISGSTIGLSGEPGTASSVKFAIADVVDNHTIEGEGDSDHFINTDVYGYGYYSNGSFDDGDYMIESLIEEDGAFKWEASINSKNISDGPVTLHYVVFDKAGNFSAEQTVECFVKNNGPRIAGVIFGTDEDGNGEVSDSELEQTKYYNAYEKGMNGRNKMVSVTFPANASDASASSVFAIKGRTRIKPEIVGGNGALSYTYTVAKRKTTVVNGQTVDAGDGWDNPYYSYTTAGSLGTNITGTAESDTVVNLGTNGGIDLTVAQLLAKDASDNEITDGENQKFVFTITDSTPGSSGVASQSANLNMILDVALKDETPATNKIIPFYWNSSSSNSLKGNSKDNGHIDLTKDLPAAFSATATSGIFDRDPKVSGAFKLEGIAQDNIVLSSLSVKIGEGESAPTYTIASYDSSAAETGFMAPASPAANSGWSVAIRNATYDEFMAAGYISALPQGVDGSDPVPYTSQAYGHVIHWAMTIETEVAAMSINPQLDLVITVSALDNGLPTLNNDGSVSYTSNDFANNGVTGTVGQTGGTSDGSAAYTCKYKIDVVPYILGIKTKLSAKKKQNDSSEMDRTALGHYPVAKTERIGLYGFNLLNTTLYDSPVDAEGNPTTPHSAALATTKTKDLDGDGVDDSTIDVYPTAANGLSYFTSGNVYVKYGDGTGDNAIISLNNYNDNDAKGSATTSLPQRANYGKKATQTTYNKYFYNHKPNSSNNYILTDDTVLDVWNINSNSGRAYPAGRVDEVIMKTNPASKIIGFSFLSGSMHYSYPKGKNNSYSDDTVGTGATGDARTTSFLSYDYRGWTYAIDAGGNEGDRVKFWIVDDSGTDKGSVAIEKVNQNGKRSENGGSNIDLRYKVRSPSIATSKAENSTTTNTTNMYLAYYDSYNDEIRFKAGNTSSKEMFAARSRDQYTCSNSQVIATNATTNLPTGANYQYTGTPLGGAGEFVAIDVIPKYKLVKVDNTDTVVNNTSIDHDVVVIVWYDVAAKALKYAYNTNPRDLTWQSDNATTNTTGTAGKDANYRGLNRVNWTGEKTIFEDAGEYCQVKVDGNGGVHIAAYDNQSGDLRYAYLPAYNSTYSEETMSCIVDSFNETGSHLIMDVALDADNNPVPYISYTCGNLPKIAYKHTSTVKDGAINDMFTGDWEAGYVPTKSSISDLEVKRRNNLDNRINVALWKDGEGKQINSQTGDYSATVSSGTIWGNGTAYPVLGYSIDNGGDDTIETAQMQ